MATNNRICGMPKMPTLGAGEHKQRLRAELMATHGQRKWVVSRWIRAAAVFATVALLMGAGAGVKEAYDSFRTTFVGVSLGKLNLDAEGNQIDEKIASVSISRSQPFNVATEAEAQEKMKEWSDAVAGKSYQFVREYESPDGEREYEYALRLAGGRERKVSGAVRLEEVSSWAQWQERIQAVAQQRYKQFRQALKEGKVRIVADDTVIVHVCRDTASGTNIEVFRHHLPDGALYATIEESRPPSSSVWQTTSWQTHLDALAQGKRKLLEVRATPVFTYAYPGADGRMIKRSLGGMPVEAD
jgi:hypothetical protein